MSFYILFVLLNRPIEDVTVEYDKTLLSGRHIHSLFAIILHVTSSRAGVIMLYSVLSCIAEVGAETKTIQKFAGEQYSFKRRYTQCFVITEKALLALSHFRHY